MAEVQAEEQGLTGAEEARAAAEAKCAELEAARAALATDRDGVEVRDCWRGPCETVALSACMRRALPDAPSPTSPSPCPACTPAPNKAALADAEARRAAVEARLSAHPAWPAVGASERRLAALKQQAEAASRAARARAAEADVGDAAAALMAAVAGANAAAVAAATAGAWPMAP